MILGFDIGNSNTVLAIYKNNEVLPVKTYRFKTNKNDTADEIWICIKGFLTDYFKNELEFSRINGAAYSSVVPEINNKYDELYSKNFKSSPLRIGPKIKLNIKINYDNPEELGVDRIVNAAAAHEEYHKDVIIVDIGTAITFCVLHSNGVFDGGLIAPGIGVSMEALASKASNLRNVKFEKIDNIIAKNTIDALKSGFFTAGFL